MDAAVCLWLIKKNLSIMQVVYLKDGRKCKLISKIAGNYIVDPFAWYQEYENEDGESEEYEELSGKLEQVERVFKVAPIEIIQEEYEAIADKVDEMTAKLMGMQGELRTAEYKLQQAKNQKTDLSRYIINREELRNAKRLILWPKDHITPRIMDGGIRSHKFTVSYELTQYAEQERVWCYELWSEDKDSNWSSSTYFDPEYGIKVNLTDEQILAITHERQHKKKFDDYALRNADNKWLTPENIERKAAFAEQDRKRAIETAEKELIQAQNKLNILKNELAVS